MAVPGPCECVPTGNESLSQSQQHGSECVYCVRLHTRGAHSDLRYDRAMVYPAPWVHEARLVTAVLLCLAAMGSPIAQIDCKGVFVSAHAGLSCHSAVSYAMMRNLPCWVVYEYSFASSQHTTQQ